MSEQTGESGNNGTEPPNAGAERSPLKVTKALEKRIKAAMDEHDRIDDARGELNAEKAEIRSSLKKAGVKLKAFDAVLRLRRLEETAERDAWDESFDVCRRAAGIPLQADMFATKH